MIRSFGGKMPQIASSAFVSEVAYVVGDVEIGENSSVWPGAVIRADFAPIKIGKNTDIEDNCVLHGGGGPAVYPASEPMEIGDNVILGHGAMMHGSRIGNNVLVGINATILHEAEVGDFCVVAANAVVAGGARIPSGSFVAGAPAEVKGPVTEHQMVWFEKHLDFYPQLAKRYKEQGL